MLRSLAALALLLPCLILNTTAQAAETTNPYVGYWALTLPSGAPGWLGIYDDGGKLSGKILWAVGSVVPVSSVEVTGGKLIVTRKHPSGKKGVKATIETITGTCDGDTLALTTVKKSGDGKESDKGTFSGKRTPPMPPKPDLSKVKFGKPISIFNGKDLTGWRLVETKAANGWIAHDGVLTNDVTEAKASKKHYGNLRTDAEFEDFNLTLETNVPKDSNSGIYLRGIYEVQVLDSYGKPLDPHNMGAIYSRITPSVAAEKPAGQWQTFDITLVDRHATVILNGKTIIDNQPVEGCTGGALWADPMKPGPIYLQGDHSGANYRNILLRPVVK
jgi:hypothetical protein